MKCLNLLKSLGLHITPCVTEDFAMLTRRTFLRIRKKLNRKHNVLKIASETGTRLETISAIADGWTPVFRKPGRPRQNPDSTADASSPAVRDSKNPTYHQYTDQLPARCPQCGRLVYMPCLECRLGRMPKKSPRLNLHLAGDRDLALDLKPEWRERYETIHREKIARHERELQLRLEEENAMTRYTRCFPAVVQNTE